MAEVRWIKITTDIFDDEKILLIETLPEADSIIVIWFKLLCLAGKVNNSGVFLMNDKIPYTDKMLATIFRRKETTVALALKTFEEFGMIELIDDVITIPNWGKHQKMDQLEQKKEYQREYMRNYREKQKKIACKTNGKSNSKTNSKANVSSLDKEIDKDIDIENKRNNYCPEFEEFWSIYPRKEEKSAAYKQYHARLREGYSESELLEAAKSYAEECKKENKEKKFIKLPKTFLGVNTPFVDHIPKKPQTDAFGREYKDGLLVWNIKFPESEHPPYYGAPPEWFEDGELVLDRVTAVYQPKDFSVGFYEPKVLTKEDVLEEITFRKEYFAKHGETDG